MLDTLFSYRVMDSGSFSSRVASMTTGRFSSIRALGPCFISPAGALRVDVGNFLQLQSAFECDRKMNPSSEIQEIGVPEELPGERFVDPRLIALQNRLHFVREAHELQQEMFRAFFAERAAYLAQIHGHEHERG